MAKPTALSGTRRIAFAMRDAHAFLDVRAPMLAEAIHRRHAVLCLTPLVDAALEARFRDIGASIRAVRFEPQGFNPLAGYRVRAELTAALAAFAPQTLAIAGLDLVATLAACGERARIPHIVPMLPEAPQVLDKALRKAFSAASALIVETGEPVRSAAVAQALAPGALIRAVPAAGVDLQRTSAVAMPAIGAGLTFLGIAPRGDDGAEELFQAAARIVGPRAPLARFVTAKAGKADAEVADAHVVVHAGQRAGLAPGLLSGLALGRPLITSDVAGARETVDERVNGCRVPPGDAAALADAMISFLRRPDELTAMARASRAKAERRFDGRAINGANLEVLGLGESFAAAAA